MEQDKDEAPDTPVAQLKKAGNERLSDPFYFSFLCSLAALNWKTIYFLLWPGGSWTAAGRIQWVEDNLYQDPISNWLKLLILPIAFASFYVAVLPGWVGVLYSRRHRAERRLEMMKAAIDEEETKIKFQVDLLKETIKNKEEAIADLNTEIGQLNEKHKTDLENAGQGKVTAVIEALAGIQALVKHDPQIKQSLRKVVQGGTPTNPNIRKALEEGGFIKVEGGKMVLTEIGAIAANDLGVDR